MNPGWYKMSNEAYHSGEGISKSGLFTILRSPAHFKAPKKETDALNFGAAFHPYVLEREKFDSEFIVKPEGMKFSTTDGKAWKKEAEDSKKQIITFGEFEQIKGMSDAIWNHDAAALLSDGEAEISGFWMDPIRPHILCKLRADWINKPRQLIVDLKSCVDARPHAFTRDAYKFGYHMQAAWYTYGAMCITGIEHKEFYFIAVEKEPPYGVQVYRATEEMILEGQKACAKALEIYDQCLTADWWPCYEEVVLDLGLPGWVSRQNGDDLTEIFE